MWYATSAQRRPPCHPHSWRLPSVLCGARWYPGARRSGCRQSSHSCRFICTVIRVLHQELAALPFLACMAPSHATFGRPDYNVPQILQHAAAMQFNRMSFRWVILSGSEEGASRLLAAGGMGALLRLLDGACHAVLLPLALSTLAGTAAA